MKSNFLVPFSLACCWAFSKFSHKPSPENREAIFLNSVVALIMYGQISTLLHTYLQSNMTFNKLMSAFSSGENKLGLDGLWSF